MVPRFLFILLIATGISGCVATSTMHNLTEQDINSLSVTKVEVAHAQDIGINWPVKKKEFEGPEDQQKAFLISQVEKTVMQSFQKNFTKYPNKSRKVRMRIVVKGFSIMSREQRAGQIVFAGLIGGIGGAAATAQGPNAGIASEVSIIDARSGNIIASSRINTSASLSLDDHQNLASLLATKHISDIEKWLYKRK